MTRMIDQDFHGKGNGWPFIFTMQNAWIIQLPLNGRRGLAEAWVFHLGLDPSLLAQDDTFVFHQVFTCLFKR
jgi:hypothetical protein